MIDLQEHTNFQDLEPKLAVKNHYNNENNLIKKFQVDRQLWKHDYSPSDKLVNNAGIWSSMDNWKLPPDDSPGVIKNLKTNKVLTVMNDAITPGSKVTEEEDRNSGGQQWNIEGKKLFSKGHQKWSISRQKRN